VAKKRRILQTEQLKKFRTKKTRTIQSGLKVMGMVEGKGLNSTIRELKLQLLHLPLLGNK